MIRIPSIARPFILALLAPSSYNVESADAPIVVPFLLALTAVLLFGLTMGHGISVTASAALVTAGILWVVLSAVLVVSASILDLKLSWINGARIISLASLPLLLRLIVGGIVAAITALSPFLVTCSPILFWKQAPAWAARLDVFELWAIGLLAILLHRCKGCGVQRAIFVSLIVWLVGFALIEVIRYL